MLNLSRQTAVSVARSISAALSVALIALCFQPTAAKADASATHDGRHGRDNGLISRWDIECNFGDRDGHGDGRARSLNHRDRGGRCEAYAVVYATESQDRVTPSGPGEIVDPVVPVPVPIPVPVPVSPHRLAVFCDDIGWIYNDEADFLGGGDVAEVRGYRGGFPALIIKDHRDGHGVLSSAMEGGDDDENRFESTLLFGTGDELKGSCRIQQDGRDGWDGQTRPNSARVG